MLRFPAQPFEFRFQLGEALLGLLAQEALLLGALAFGFGALTLLLGALAFGFGALAFLLAQQAFGFGALAFLLAQQAFALGAPMLCFSALTLRRRQLLTRRH